jgi:hypothetical protein
LYPRIMDKFRRKVTLKKDMYNNNAPAAWSSSNVSDCHRRDWSYESWEDPARV